jgi:hypothetical protein
MPLRQGTERLRHALRRGALARRGWNALEAYKRPNKNRTTRMIKIVPPIP